MDPIDSDINDRLQNLRQPMDRIPTDDELRERLRQLKDLPTTPATTLHNKYILFPPRKSSTEMADDLMKQFTEEVEIRKNYVPSVASVDEIEKRLQKLKSHDGVPQSNTQKVQQPGGSDAKILLKKILAEAELEKKTESELTHLARQLGKKDESMEVSDSEEEFCTICVRRPKWMCLDCERPFCARCFDEYHDQYGETHHQKKLITCRRRKSSTDSNEYSD